MPVFKPLGRRRRNFVISSSAQSVPQHVRELLYPRLVSYLSAEFSSGVVLRNQLLATAGRADFLCKSEIPVVFYEMGSRNVNTHVVGGVIPTSYRYLNDTKSSDDMRELVDTWQVAAGTR